MVYNYQIMEYYTEMSKNQMKENKIPFSLVFLDERNPNGDACK